MGMLVPEMGSQRQARRDNTARTGMADALFSPEQRRLRGLIFGQADRSFQSAEIIRLAGSSGREARPKLFQK
jgi:hypothetical protein